MSKLVIKADSIYDRITRIGRQTEKTEPTLLE